MKNGLLFSKTFLCIFLLSCLSIGCSTKHDFSEVTKFAESDPFQNSMALSEVFQIDAKEDQVIEGKKGTVIVFPKGCFLNRAGETVESEVEIELAEALTLDDMLLSNLTTTADGKLLETDGMIYFNAKANGEQLRINEKNPLYIEIPTDFKKPDMMAYEGIRDVNGNMDWQNPKKLEEFLVTYDFDLLDFYPEGFVDAVEKGLPFRGHQETDAAFLDSLYYSLSVSDGSELNGAFKEFDVNEPYHNKSVKVQNGKYTKEAFQTKTNSHASTTSHGHGEKREKRAEGSVEKCSVDPAIIQTLRTSRFRNTLIATKEFEERLKVLLSECREGLIELYIQNLDKNLWEIDSMVAEKTFQLNQEGPYMLFYKNGKTKVKDAQKYAKGLNKYYEERLRNVRNELMRARRKAIKGIQMEEKATEKLLDDYRKVLVKREKIRMETYGFEWTQTGWINVDRGTIPKTWGPQKLEVMVENASEYEQVYTYIVYRSIKSIYRLNENGGGIFWVGNEAKKEMNMPKNETALLFSIAYLNKTPSGLGTSQFLTGSLHSLDMKVNTANPKEIKAAIAAYDKWNAANSIQKDLQFMEELAFEKKKQAKKQKEADFIKSLHTLVWDCCPLPDSFNDLYWR